MRFAVSALLVALGASLAGQTPRRDIAQTSGASTIRGRVAALDTGRPIRGAIVRASAPELAEARSAATDAQGRYELRDLPAGRYTLTASKPTCDGSRVPQDSRDQRRPRVSG